MSWFSKQLGSAGLGGVSNLWGNTVQKIPGITSAANFTTDKAHQWDVGGRNDKFWPAFATVGGALAGGSSLWGAPALGATAGTSSGAAAPAAGGSPSWMNIAKDAQQLQGFMGGMPGVGAQQQTIHPYPWMLGSPEEQAKAAQMRAAQSAMAGAQGAPAQAGTPQGMAGMGKGGAAPYMAQTPGGQ